MDNVLKMNKKSRAPTTGWKKEYKELSSKYTPLYEKTRKKKKKVPMETTTFDRNLMFLLN